MVVALSHELVGPEMESPLGVEWESLSEGWVGCYDARWGFAFECAPIVRGKGPPSQLGAWWVRSGWVMG
jgi:hypothetical protein